MMLRRVWMMVALVATGSIAPVAAHAQRWTFGLEGGQIRSTLDQSAEPSRSFAADIGYDGPSNLARLSAGIPASTDATQWGAIGLWRRMAVTSHRVVAGVDLAGNAFAFRGPTITATSLGGLFQPGRTTETHSSGTAAAVQVLPVIGYEWAQFKLYAHVGMSYFGKTTDSTSLHRSVQLSDVQLSYQPVPTVAVTPVLRQYRAPGENVATFAGTSLAMSKGHVDIWGSAGTWTEGVDSVTGGKAAWGAGASLRVTDRASVIASARHDSFDPLYLTPAQTSWSAGLSLMFAGPAQPAAPVPAHYENGKATIRLPLSAATSQPRIAGDFNSWTPTNMERDGKYWVYTFRATPGVYSYSFVTSDGTWFVPEGTPGRKDDGMGGHVAVLVIR